MSCQTQASPRKKSICGCTESLGNSGVAGTSLTRLFRKPKSAALSPDSPERWFRVECFGKVAMLYLLPSGGWISIMKGVGVLVNPWTKKPFNSLKSAISASKAHMKNGFFPGHQPPCYHNL